MHEYAVSMHMSQRVLWQILPAVCANDGLGDVFRQVAVVAIGEHDYSCFSGRVTVERTFKADIVSSRQ